jgi:large subunit ribosomal protein L22
MIYRAKHRYADVSSRKIRPFAQLVRGKNVDEALEALRFLPNRGARQLEAVIKSAIGNAEDQGCRNLEDLVVTECRVDGGPMYKRIRPRARGTAFMIKRRLSHIVVALTDLESLEESMAAAASPEPIAPSQTPTPESQAASAAQ